MGMVCGMTVGPLQGEKAVTWDVPEGDLGLIREILRLSAGHGLGPQWLGGRRGVFAVGDHRQFFKVWSDGHVSFPFSRLHTDHFEALASRLNEVLPRTSQLGPADAKSKGKGDQLSTLFQGQQLKKFFEIWTWFRDMK